MVEELTNGTVVALQLEGPEAVARLRRLAGKAVLSVAKYHQDVYTKGSCI